LVKLNTHRGGKGYREGAVIKGVPGKRGSHVRITVANNGPDELYLYCSV